MSLEATLSQAKWLEGKIQLAESRQQVITAAFLTRFKAEAQQVLAKLPLPKTHPRSLADKVALAEVRQAALLAAFIGRHGASAQDLAGRAARQHGFETGRSASKVIHTTGAAAESVYSALCYFLLDGGADDPEPLITENSQEKFSWSRIVCPNHAYWSGHTASYLFLVKIEGEWIGGFVDGYCYTASHERKIFMNVGPVSYCDTITVDHPEL